MALNPTFGQPEELGQRFLLFFVFLTELPVAVFVFYRLLTIIYKERHVLTQRT